MKCLCFSNAIYPPIFILHLYLDVKTDPFHNFNDGLTKFTFNKTFSGWQYAWLLKNMEIRPRATSSCMLQGLGIVWMHPNYFLFSSPYLCRYPQILRWCRLHIDVTDRRYKVVSSVRASSQNSYSTEGYNLYIIIGQTLCRNGCEILSISKSVYMMIENSLSNPSVFIYESVGRCQSPWLIALKWHAGILMLKWLYIGLSSRVQESYTPRSLNSNVSTKWARFNAAWTLKDLWTNFTTC